MVNEVIFDQICPDFLLYFSECQWIFVEKGIKMCRIWCRSPIYCIDAHYFSGSIVVVYLNYCIFQKYLRCLLITPSPSFRTIFQNDKMDFDAATYFTKDVKIVVQSWLMDEKSTMYMVVHSTNFWGQKSRARVFWKRSKSNYSFAIKLKLIVTVHVIQTRWSA